MISAVRTGGPEMSELVFDIQERDTIETISENRQCPIIRDNGFK